MVPGRPLLLRGAQRRGNLGRENWLRLSFHSAALPSRPPANPRSPIPNHNADCLRLSQALLSHASVSSQASRRLGLAPPLSFTTESQRTQSVTANCFSTLWLHPSRFSPRLRGALSPSPNWLCLSFHSPALASRSPANPQSAIHNPRSRPSRPRRLGSFVVAGPEAASVIASSAATRQSRPRELASFVISRSGLSAGRACESAIGNRQSQLSFTTESQSPQSITPNCFSMLWLHPSRWPPCLLGAFRL